MKAALPHEVRAALSEPPKGLGSTIKKRGGAQSKDQKALAILQSLPETTSHFQGLEKKRGSFSGFE